MSTTPSSAATIPEISHALGDRDLYQAVLMGVAAADRSAGSDHGTGSGMVPSRSVRVLQRPLIGLSELNAA